MNGTFLEPLFSNLKLLLFQKKKKKIWQRQEFTGVIDPKCQSEELTSSTKECSIKQIMNHFIQIHILFG